MKEKLSKGRIKGIIVVIGVIILPLLYSYFYLGAFWDPYSRLESLPVAVVNNDQGALINDEQRNLGQEMCDKLKEKASLKFVFTDEADAKAGTEGKDYYAMLVIPENFSANIASASTTDKQIATITFSSNEKRNYLASQILSRAVLEIEESTRESVNQQIVQELVDNMKAVPDQMIELQDGLGQLYSGSSDLKDGAAKLAKGTTTFSDKFSEYSKGITDVKTGSSALNTGAAKLDTGIDALLAGANKLVTSTASLDQLTTGSKTLAEGAKTFNASLIQYTAGVDQLISSVSSTSQFLTQYVTTINPSIMKDPVFAGFIKKLSDPANATSIQTLQAANTKLKEASAQISAGAAQLAKGTTNLPQLKAALSTISNGLASAKAGSAALAQGSQTLVNGMAKLGDATTQLETASKDIASGATDLSNGAVKLSDGIETAKTGVDTSITDTNDQLAALDGLADFAKAPVEIETDNVTSVPNYGTAFAPYFLSLSLWVGALIIFVGIYLDPDNKFRILSRNSENKVARSFIYLAIGIGQAVILAAVVQFGLGLKVENVPLYYLSCCLVSLVFISIVQFNMVYLKDFGKFLSMVLLILQLTSCAGTFPMETVPKIFNTLYPYMPMTYSVALFKQAISGVVTSDVLRNGGILCIILVVFMALTVALAAVKSKRAAKASDEVEVAL
jgi:putative membrane protein